MSHAEQEIVAALRAEVAAVDPARPCDRRAELAGLGGSAPRDAATARLVVRLLRRVLLLRAGDVASPFDWDVAPEHCRTAYLRGRYLATGSLSLANGRTHLEFVVPPDDAPGLATRLATIGPRASWRVRRGRGVVTWKSSEVVGTFLRRIGAGAAMLELEARGVARAMHGDMNRVLNAESANLERSVAAAGRQLAAIDLLDVDGRLAEQPYVVRAVAAGRRETPEATFSELATRLGIHRSAVQRALVRLERLALETALA